MPATANSDKLAEKRNVTVILRLVVDSRSRLAYGEIVDLEAVSPGRFVGWRGLTPAVRAWVMAQEHSGTSHAHMESSL